MSAALRFTPSQNTGPFFSSELLRTPLNALVRPETAGQRITIVGTVFDGQRAPMLDALVEIWQANAFGRYHHPRDPGHAQLDPTFIGFGRSGTEDGGRYWFETIMPGVVRDPAVGAQAPHVNVAVSARGLVQPVLTRIYFENHPPDDDPVFRLVPHQRRHTLVARRVEAGARVRYSFDIVMQGPDETVFFKFPSANARGQPSGRRGPPTGSELVTP